MRTMRVRLLDNESLEEMDDVILIAAADGSGSFSILPGHIPFMTMLDSGLVRIRHQDGSEDYLGQPGGLLEVRPEGVSITTRRLFRGPDAAALEQALQSSLDREESRLRTARATLKHMEDEVLRRIFELEPRKAE